MIQILYIYIYIYMCVCVCVVGCSDRILLTCAYTICMYKYFSSICFLCDAFILEVRTPGQPLSRIYTNGAMLFIFFCDSSIGFLTRGYNIFNLSLILYIYIYMCVWYLFCDNYWLCCCFSGSVLFGYYWNVYFVLFYYDIKKHFPFFFKHDHNL